MTRAHLSLGVAGSLGPETIAAIAAKAEASGYHALWVNDTPTGDSLAALGAAAQVTDTLVLATGVLPVDRRSAGEIVRAVRAHALPQERLVLGIGAGQRRAGGLALVGDAVRMLHGETSARVLVGALGPRMRLLAAEQADGALLSWLSPDEAAAQAKTLRDDAGMAGRVDGGYAALYVRTAVDEAAMRRRDEEGAQYAGYPAYAANFARLGLTPADTMLPLPGGAGIGSGLAAFATAVDEVVLRAITAGDDLEHYLSFVDRARGALTISDARVTD
ncbi:LLM class flavin-dependent oxidoreductase [Microbacterium sp. P03]|uniref:LLM class flavin-dependent oxidoreductase n=1 Tax=Microbacterium sp. P03 TaxID=3366946 RepID=UPI00374672DD